MNSQISKQQVTSTSMVIAGENQVSSVLADEVVILDPDGGMYYGLDEVGARVWALIQEERAVTEIKNTILAEYQVEPERCECDILALLQDMANRGLIAVKNGVTA